MVFAVYLQLDKIIRYNKETLDIHEAVVLDQATKNKVQFVFNFLYFEFIL